MTLAGRSPLRGDRSATQRIASVLVASLSAGRRPRALLDAGAGRSFQTDLETVTVPYPPAQERLRTLTCALALQASPSKEAVASTPWTGFRKRKRTALAWVEGEMAVRWAARTWPGLRDDLLAAFPWVEDGPVITDPDELAELAGRRARSPRLGEPPPLLGRMPQPARPAGGRLRQTFIATRWSSRHKARREGALPIPVSGPGTEPVLHPGEPGTIEALEGRAGHELGIPYSEWDRFKGRYRHDYVRVMELDGPTSIGAAPPSLPIAPARPARQVRRHFEDGTIDIDAVVAWRCDLAAGRSAGDVRLFTRLAPVAAPTAWALLVDASASASLRGGQVLTTGLAHANALAAALSAQNEKVGVLAFRSRARERVEVRVLKHFDRPFRPLTRDLRPGGYTRLGAALRHAGARLAEVPARARALIYLGDAVPYDEGYGDRYARADVAKAVSELRSRGVVVRHASLAESDARALDEMFGPAGWRRTTDTSQLLALSEEVTTELERET